MSLFHIHKWTRWEPIKMKYSRVKAGKIHYTYNDEQRRECTTCGRVQNRGLY